MNRDFHENYLKELEKDYGKGLLVSPSKEGALYFGRELTYDEYVDEYRSTLQRAVWDFFESKQGPFGLRPVSGNT